MAHDQLQNTMRKGFTATKLFLSAVVVLILFAFILTILGDLPQESRPDPINGFCLFAFSMGVLVVGGLVADHFFNPNSKKILGQKHSGLASITSKYNEQITVLKNQYLTDIKELKKDGSINTRSLRQSYSSRYDTIHQQYVSERMGFISFWKKENRRYSLFSKLWAWLFALGFCGAFFGCTYTMGDETNANQVQSARTTNDIYWNAETIPLPHLTDGTQYVSNPDSVLSASTVAKINETMLQLDNEFGIETAVIVVNHIENDDPFRMAQDVGNRYGVGRDDRGLVIVVGYEDHSINISPGRSLEADLTDVECRRLEQRYVVPAMKAELPDSAMLYLAEGLYAFMKEKPLPEMTLRSNEDDSESAAFGLYSFFFVVWLIFMMFMRRKYGWMSDNGSRALISNPFIERPVYVSTGGSSFGSSGSRGGFGGGGFSGGYGGGSFGGGGATSRW